MVARIARQREWAYDKILAELGRNVDDKMRELQQDEVDLTNTKRVLWETERKLRNSKDEKKVKGYRQTTIEACHNNIGIHEYNIRNTTRLIPYIRRSLQAFRQARPILIGPATLDSLINQEPDRYDYVSTGHLPFDLMFFEFLEPFRMSAPFHKGEVDTIGLSFYKHSSFTAIRQLHESEGNKPPYTANIYYAYEGGMKAMSIDFDPVSQAIFSCAFIDRKFIIDMEKNEVKYFKASELSEEVISRGRISDKDFRRMPLPECPNYQVIIQIANLCTNLINYINSHNTTFTRRNRVIPGSGSTNQGRRPPHQGRRPPHQGRRSPRQGRGSQRQRFYVVTIKDKVKQEPEHPSNQTWTLTERIYVRGHPRRLRNEDGEIRRVTWIPPCVKGPPDAPFANQRYQVLAERLLRERQMLNELE